MYAVTVLFDRMQYAEQVLSFKMYVCYNGLFFCRMYVCCNGFILLKCMYAVTVLFFKMYVIMVIRHDQSAFRSLLLRFRAHGGNLRRGEYYTRGTVRRNKETGRRKKEEEDGKRKQDGLISHSLVAPWRGAGG